MAMRALVHVARRLAQVHRELQDTIRSKSVSSFPLLPLRCGSAGCRLARRTFSASQLVSLLM